MRVIFEDVSFFKFSNINELPFSSLLRDQQASLSVYILSKKNTIQVLHYTFLKWEY